MAEPETHGEDDDDAREATEMRDQGNDSGMVDGKAGRGQVLDAASKKSSRSDGQGMCFAIRTFWKRQVRVTVSHDDCRDHFGKVFYLRFPIVWILHELVCGTLICETLLALLGIRVRTEIMSCLNGIRMPATTKFYHQCFPSTYIEFEASCWPSLSFACCYFRLRYVRSHDLQHSNEPSWAICGLPWPLRS